MSSIRQRIQQLRKKPEPAPTPAPVTQASFRDQSLDLMLGRFGLPGVLVRQALADFKDLRPWWPILIPVLLYIAVTTYRRERAEVLAARNTTNQH